MPRQYDKEKWEAAQVTTMDEFKKRLEKAAIEQIKQAEKFVEAQEAGQISQKINQVSKDTQVASKELGDFMQMAENLAMDEEEPEVTPEELAAMDAESHAAAKASLLEELGQMAIEAANKGKL